MEKLILALKVYLQLSINTPSNKEYNYNVYSVPWLV